VKPIPPFALMDEWTPSQLLAVYDFCQLITESLWQRYDDILIQEMIASDRQNGFHSVEPPLDDDLQQPFDDDIPF
jgi:hypothetical protein